MAKPITLQTIADLLGIISRLTVIALLSYMITLVIQYRSDLPKCGYYDSEICAAMESKFTAMVWITIFGIVTVSLDVVMFLVIHYNTYCASRFDHNLTVFSIILTIVGVILLVVDMSLALNLTVTLLIILTTISIGIIMFATGLAFIATHLKEDQHEQAPLLV